MEEKDLIAHCAPTLAGLKTGSIFTCPCDSRDALFRSLLQLNRLLISKGLRLTPLRISGQRALIYVYRPQKLSRDLRNETAAALLKEQGYDPERSYDCVCRLAHKLQQQAEFPHEIGLFLGYPPEDVRGFMEQGPDRSKYTGCWKVYGDPEAAREKFAQYKNCTRVYRECWDKNPDIRRLTVAEPPPSRFS